MGATQTTQCMFCGLARSRGLEHALAQSHLRDLGTGQDVINVSVRRFHDEQIEKSRSHTLQSLVCGDVCRFCNEGWMSRLEDKMKPLLIGLGCRSELLNLQQDGTRIGFTRWALKTASVIDRIGGLREVPPNIPRALYENQGGVPERIFLLVGWHATGQPGILTFNQRNLWGQYPRSEADSAPGDPPDGWFKVSFAVGRIMVLVAHVPDEHFQVVIGSGVHTPIWPSTRVECHHYFHTMQVEGLPIDEALQTFSDALAVSVHGRMW